MALKKTVLIKSHGVPASIHRVDAVNVDLNNKAATISVSSFYDEDALKSGLSPLSSMSIYVQAAPESGQDLLAFAESTLAADKPESAPSALPAPLYGADRYVLAGAQIVTVAAQ